jgi:hypothetical protein
MFFDKKRNSSLFSDFQIIKRLEGEGIESI